LSDSKHATSGESVGAPSIVPTKRRDFREAIEATVSGLGYELVDVERAPRGLLRVTIDRLPGREYPAGEGGLVSEFITVDDCEQVTRQLQYSLEVDAVEYERLEVSSPGLDRPLRKAVDFERFSGQEISLTLKQPFQGRKGYRGLLGRTDTGFSLVFHDGKVDQVLAFGFDEVREARLVPVIDFKGRRQGATGADAAKPGAPRKPPAGGARRGKKSEKSVNSGEGGPAAESPGVDGGQVR
jgi:ribosome maturation factor RimP